MNNCDQALFGICGISMQGERKKTAGNSGRFHVNRETKINSI